MGSLSNLYISQSYQSLLHFATDSGSTATLTEIEDGLGVGLGVYLNNSGSASFDGDVTIGGDLVISGAIDIEGAIVIRDNVYVTGSIYSSADISSSRVLTGEITASNVRVNGTLTAYEVHTIIESSSIIFSTGSNILGDSILDTQTLNGTIIVSGSEQVTGSMGISGDLEVKGNISSSTISGIGNVTTYSQSVDSRLDYLEGPFSTSVDQRLDSLENFTSSTYINFSTSVDSRLDYLEGPFSSSVSQQLVTLQLFTASVGLVTTQSFQEYTASTNADLAAIHQTTASLNTTTASLNVSISNLNSTTASLNTYTQSVTDRFTYTPTTGSNTYVGNQIFSGSVRGGVNTLSISSQTASIDCSLGNFFTLQLPNSSATHLTATNIQPGETISLLITQGNPISTLNYNTSLIKFPNANPYSVTTVASAQDILTFVSFTTASLYGVATNRLT